MSAASSKPVRDLTELLQGLARPPRSLVLSDLTQDSRAATRGCAFLACRGHSTHGLEFAAQAVERGARAVLWEPAANIGVPDFPSDIVVTAVPELSRHVGTLADRFFGAPSAQLEVTAITGTNGKTTCAYLLAQALGVERNDAAYMGTIGVGRPGALASASLTTADAVTVHRQLAELRASGIKWIVMEVSSHALDQHRVGGVRFKAAAFTNLTRDHLDYHGTMAAYGEAKAKLFVWPGLAARVINVDDEFGAELARRAGQSGELVSVSRNSRRATDAARERGRWMALTDARIAANGLSLDVDSSWGRARIDTRLVGDFNVDNALTVFALLQALGVPSENAARVLSQVHAPSGRMETFGGGGAPLAIVDYAHTPDALEKALNAARAHCAGRLWVVFGCGGDRDPGKRPLMGEIASRLADRVILTDDNPRTESPEAIVAGIRSSLTTRAEVTIEHDRARAIGLAIERAAPSDAILIAGKGHEDYQIYGRERRPFSDQAVVRAALARRAA
jgi:UDP-N-acetylmuramoyl-L-alanyl-D-glutamate--2,6-diaminopimelate ligase